MSLYRIKIYEAERVEDKKPSEAKLMTFVRALMKKGFSVFRPPWLSEYSHGIELYVIDERAINSVDLTNSVNKMKKIAEDRKLRIVRISSASIYQKV